jgi:hypothetical protein
MLSSTVLVVVVVVVIVIVVDVVAVAVDSVRHVVVELNVNDLSLVIKAELLVDCCFFRIK